jgi:hypothetical protein
MVQTIEPQAVWLSQLWTDPVFIRAYEATVVERRRWEASVQQALRTLLGVTHDLPLDVTGIPSASEIRAQMRGHLPYETKLSELVIRESEERT